jgi:hypothetical protein
MSDAAAKRIAEWCEEYKRTTGERPKSGYISHSRGWYKLGFNKMRANETGPLHHRPQGPS